jgi:glycosyltransferase involved in cell wall biosynthesis
MRRILAAIAGDGPRSDRVERLAEANDEVTYHGHVSEKHKRTLLRNSSIYVLPTYAEGLPIAMLEGMAGANAVVTTSVGSNPEVIDEDNGILVEPGNVDALVDALERLITSPDERSAMAKTNRRIIEERYSWHQVTEELIGIYESQY